MRAVPGRSGSGRSDATFSSARRLRPYTRRFAASVIEPSTAVSSAPDRGVWVRVEIVTAQKGRRRQYRCFAERYPHRHFGQPTHRRSTADRRSISYKALRRCRSPRKVPSLSQRSVVSATKTPLLLLRQPLHKSPFFRRDRIHHRRGMGIADFERSAPTCSTRPRVSCGVGSPKSDRFSRWDGRCGRYLVDRGKGHEDYQYCRNHPISV